MRLRVFLVLLLGVTLFAQSGGERVQPLAWAEERDAMLVERLRALEPGDPMAYFELGEEVVSSFPGARGYGLARELFALAYALDAERGGPLDLAPSAALAIAEVSDPSERRWLLTMARTLRRGEAAPTGRGEVSREWARCAEVVTLHRAGAYQRMRPLLRRVDMERTLRDAGLPTEDAVRLVILIEDAASNDRDEGRTDPRTRSDEVMRPNPTNGGNPGPALSSDDLALSLRAELLLVGGRPATWSADLALNNAAPARDLDPGELLSITGVSAERARFEAGAEGWRDGVWVLSTP